MGGQRGRVIFLNGTSSAGKTTLAHAIQELSPQPYLLAGIDSFFAMVPEKWGGGRAGPLSRDGFHYDESDDDGAPLTVIRYGDTGRRMLRAMHASIAALTVAGNNLVIDEMLLAPELLDDWLDALTGLDVLFVGVHCPLPVLEERERARGPRGRAGLARGHLRTVHAHGHYDLDVDTGTAPASDIARCVLTRRDQGPPPAAFAVLRRDRDR
ncbi:chloramphenicol phosphotransferase CPT family protein [Longispora fulva]|uniref:Chloramphenicol 3-O phosphotransferase n=1 Tax=Longispora fulva TaxID=619741 RepID=A0A8J7KGE6_9ACTN|nr:AAA family ATPase [Longispora fulva]MBG6134869.1 chloramphenicol 3-O phosphotransferase [Longispora fulva]